MSDREMLWINRGIPCEIGPFRLPSGLIYVSDTPPKIPEPSCVVRSARIGKKSSIPRVTPSYCPEYLELTPVQRVRYLAWQSTGRRAVADDIGYVFLFFYGLERRALIERLSTTTIINEVTVLLRTYSGSRSFHKYATRFLMFALAQASTNDIGPDDCAHVLEDGIENYSIHTIKSAQALASRNGCSLSPCLAYNSIRLDARTPKSIWLTRRPSEHRALFLSLYRSTYPQGVRLEASEIPLKIEYSPANLSLYKREFREEIGAVTIPAANIDPENFNNLLDTWLSCIEKVRYKFYFQ